MHTCPIMSYSLGATYIKQTRRYVCDKMAGGPTKSRDNIDYCRLDTRFLFVRFVSHFDIPVIRAKSVPLFEPHRGQMSSGTPLITHCTRLRFRTPPGQMSCETPLIMYRTRLRFPRWLLLPIYSVEESMCYPACKHQQMQSVHKPCRPTHYRK